MIVEIFNNYVETNDIVAITSHEWHSGYRHFKRDWYTFDIIFKGSKERLKFSSLDSMQKEWMALVELWGGKVKQIPHE